MLYWHPSHFYVGPAQSSYIWRRFHVLQPSLSPSWIMEPLESTIQILDIFVENSTSSRHFTIPWCVQWLSETQVYNIPCFLIRALVYAYEHIWAHSLSIIYLRHLASNLCFNQFNLLCAMISSGRASKAASILISSHQLSSDNPSFITVQHWMIFDLCLK